MLTLVLSGSDMHLSAEFGCTSDVDCNIKGSFFFDSHNCPRTFSAGETVQLVGVDMQEWNESAQLSGKNVLIVPVPLL